MTLEPKGKLDTMATNQAAMSAVVAVVNGPEDEPLDWHAVDWRAVEEDVRRLAADLHGVAVRGPETGP